MSPRKKQKRTDSTSTSSSSSATGATPTSSSKNGKEESSNVEPLSHPHRGYGKLILFGEHFVVKPETPAIVAAINSVTTCDVELSDADWSKGLLIQDNRPAVASYKVSKAEEMEDALQRVLKHFNVDTGSRGVKLTFGGDLCAVSGVGASAAQCVSLTRALGAALGKTLTEEEVNAGGYEGEKAYHGKPSGIDNTASTYGGLMRFMRTPGEGDPEFKQLSAPSSAWVVFASTGITSSTTKVVNDVQEKKNADPQWYAGLEKKYLELVSNAEAAIGRGDWEAVARYANENHALLQELTVSCKELDVLVEAAREAGAAGAKLAGTGRGGLMFAITLSEQSTNDVFAALSKIAPNVWRTTFG